MIINEHRYFVYILTNLNKTVLYIGVTHSIEKRLQEHITGVFKGFTSKYNCHHLLYFEEHNDINSAIAREKYIKTWSRKKKNDLIQAHNPHWQFLNEGSRIIKGLSGNKKQ